MIFMPFMVVPPRSRFHRLNGLGGPRVSSVFLTKSARLRVSGPERLAPEGRRVPGESREPAAGTHAAGSGIAGVPRTEGWGLIETFRGLVPHGSERQERAPLAEALLNVADGPESQLETTRV